LPFNEPIQVPGASVLPPDGGYSEARVHHFRHRNILTMREAYSYVSGSETTNTFETSATSVVVGLNILDVVTADLVVARLTSSKPKDGTEGSISPVGSQFQNLRVAGRAIPEAENLVTDLFAELDTYGKMIGDDRAFATQRGRLDEFLTPPPEPPYPPDERTLKYLPEGAYRLDRRRGMNGSLSASLVPNIRTTFAGVSTIRNLIPVKQFGLIRVAELRIAADQRRLTMLAFDLGSPFVGTLDVCYAESNGSIWGL
ncbi:MAG TPA: choice-of-anchor P family protein, partial [Bryobacteraceae bacterium]|nr:choice-of-anchor P family protein [Bryobacteraceae bacterium]